MLGLQFPVDDELPIRLPHVMPPWLLGIDEIEVFYVVFLLLLLLLLLLIDDGMMMTMNVIVAVEDEGVAEIVGCS